LKNKSLQSTALIRFLLDPISIVWDYSVFKLKSTKPQGRAGSCPPLGLCQILGGEKVLRLFF
jgi:hypothetical protein